MKFLLILISILISFVCLAVDNTKNPLQKHPKSHKIKKVSKKKRGQNKTTEAEKSIFPNVPGTDEFQRPN